MDISSSTGFLQSTQSAASPASLQLPFFAPVHEPQPVQSLPHTFDASCSSLCTLPFSHRHITFLNHLSALMQETRPLWSVANSFVQVHDLPAPCFCICTRATALLVCGQALLHQCMTLPLHLSAPMHKPRALWSTHHQCMTCAPLFHSPAHGPQPLRSVAKLFHTSA